MELSGYERDGVVPDVQLNSRVVSVVVSNPSTGNLSRPVTITFSHLEVQRHLSPRLVFLDGIILTRVFFV